MHLTISILNIKAIEIKDKTLSIEVYLDVIRQYLSTIIDDHKQDEWKI